METTNPTKQIVLFLLFCFIAIEFHAQTLTLVSDIYPGEWSSTPENLIVYNNKLYFSASNNTDGQELWVYDGMNEPTIVADINSPGDYTHFSDFIVFNNKLYYKSRDDTHGFELWVYDGISAPHMVADICPDYDSDPDELVVFNNKLYFTAMTKIGEWYKYRFYEYDGVSDPEIVFDPLNYLNPFVFNNKLYFSAGTAEEGSELYVYDGISEPTMVYDICPGISGSGPTRLIEFNNKLLFYANDGMHGTELWEYDGVGDPSLVYDIRSGTPPSWIFHQESNMIVFDDKLYMNVYDDEHGSELWVYDGSNNPSMVKELVPGKSGLNPRNFTVYDNILYFSGFDAEGHGEELWMYDGVNDPTMVIDLRLGSLGSEPCYLTVFNDMLYFQAIDGEHGRELWSLTNEDSPSGNTDAISYLSLQVYPNPAIDKINISFNRGSFNSISIYGISGNIVSNQEIKAEENNVSLDISHIPSGIYFVKLISNDGDIEVLKVLKE
jgi:ELWxxDGT repeat protein